MSLDWSLAKCQNKDALLAEEGVEPDMGPFTPTPWVVTKHLIFGLMAIDIGTVTAKNASEVYARYCIARQLAGDDIFLTPAAINRRIGLTTNVSTRTFNQFLMAWGETQLRNHRGRYERAIAKASA